MVYHFIGYTQCIMDITCTGYLLSIGYLPFKRGIPCVRVIPRIGHIPCCTEKSFFFLIFENFFLELYHNNIERARW